MNLFRDVKNELSKLNQEPDALRKFGITICIVLSLIGGLVYLKGAHPLRALVFWAVSSVFLLMAFVIPGALKLIYKIWMGIAFVLGWFMSRLILTILFYGVVTPIGVLMRLTGRDTLDRKIDKETSSYWIRRPHSAFMKEKYTRLF